MLSGSILVGAYPPTLVPALDPDGLSAPTADAAAIATDVRLVRGDD